MVFYFVKNINISSKDPIFRQICFSLHSYPDNFGQRDPSVYLQRILSSPIWYFKNVRNSILIRLWNLQDVRGGSSSNIDMLQKISQHYEQQLDVEHFDVRRGKSIRITGRLYLHFDTEFMMAFSRYSHSSRERNLLWAAISFWHFVFDGTVVPCCLDKEGVIRWGILQTKCLDVLEGTRAKKRSSKVSKKVD